MFGIEESFTLMEGACSYCISFDVFIPLLTHYQSLSFKVVLRELVRNYLQLTVGPFSLHRCPSAGFWTVAAGNSALSPGRITLLVLVELPGLGELHPGSCWDAGNFQIPLEVRVRGEDR